MSKKLSLRCGCPVDTSAKQKHRPSRQARPPQGVWQSVFPSPVIAKPCKRLWQSVFLFKDITDSFALCAQNDKPFCNCNHRIICDKLQPLSLRCGCPVDTSAKQKHRPNRQARPPLGARQSVFPSPVIAKPCKRLWQSVFLFKDITDSFALTTLAVPKSCYSLGARTTFDRGARNVTQNDNNEKA